MELLCPAGNLLSAYAAFNGGADAIYIGGKKFSARANADNFSDQEIKEITFFAHQIGKKVYVTLNTLLFQDEFFEAVEFAKFLYSINIDGVIIQDLGLAHYLNNVLPKLPLNASTQLNCHNLSQAKALVKIGFKRIVLAREANLDFVKQVKSLGVEVEVFGHGALCVSYSGNCLLSSFIGDRSGNRGRCAQPCRMKYDLYEDNKKISSSFAISTKDLMTKNFLRDFINAGVDSLKIEGRLKSTEYIYSVSKAYRSEIDAILDSKNNQTSEIDDENLIKIFNRQFTKGYILNESPFNIINNQTSSHQGEIIGKVISTNKNRVTIKLYKDINRLDGIRFNNEEQFGLTIERMFVNRIPVENAQKGQLIDLSGIENASRLINLDVIRTKDICLVKSIEKEIKKRIKVPVDGVFTIEVGKPISLEIKFRKVKIKCFGDIALEAQNSGTNNERIVSQLNKTGIYPYYFNNLNIVGEKAFIPISSLNSLRNKCFDILMNKLAKENKVVLKSYLNKQYNLNNLPSINVIIENNEQEKAIDSTKINVFSYSSQTNKTELRVTSETKFEKNNELIHFVVDSSKNNLIASQYCNITNSFALDCYYEYHCHSVVLSTELDFLSIKQMISDFISRHGQKPSVGMLIYGKLDMMIMKSCPIGTHFDNKNIHCGRCHQHNYELQDRIGARFTILGDQNCNTRILNNKPIYLFDKIDELKDIGVDNFYLLFTDEEKEKVINLINNLNNNNFEFDGAKFTRGHYKNRPL